MPHTLKPGDRIAAQGYPEGYQLTIVAIVRGKVAIASPAWPKGATQSIDPAQILTVNERPYSPTAPKARRKAA